MIVDDGRWSDAAGEIRWRCGRDSSYEKLMIRPLNQF